MKDIMTPTFSELGLPATITDGLAAAGFETPTPIQAQAIPHQLKGRDILGIAQTGSGKTAAFGLPIIAGLLAMGGRPKPMTTRALILAPTRELAVQIEESLRKFAGANRIATVLVLGGMSRANQVNKLAKGVDVTIATPGRLQDLIEDGKLKLNETRWFVLDEADRMLDMGFIAPVKAIARAIGPNRQTALFSATMAPEVAELTKSLLKDPVRVEASAPATTVTTLDQRVILAGSKAKRGVLNTLLADPELKRVILFTRTKHGADRVTKNLAIDGHDAAAIHGNKSQNARQAALKGFASGQVRILVATDIAARGIDVPGISHVINYELPDEAENYVHRIGRTARNGASGFAITLCDGTERSKLRDVEKLIRRTLPVTGDLQAANDTGVTPGTVNEARPDRPRNERPMRVGQNSGRPGGNGRPGGSGRPGAKPGQHRADGAPRQNFAGLAPEAKAWWSKLDGEAKAAEAPRGTAAKVKGRWDKRQKDVARTKRDTAA
ncbi:MAG: RhlE [Devosia sp.]|nr:RhlE [Devosia sp.]